MLREAVAHLTDVEATSTEGLVVELARACRASVLVRGIRGATDAEYETEMASANRALAPEIVTVFLPAHAELSAVSSSRLKEMARGELEIARFCPRGVERRLRARIAEERQTTKEARHVDL